MLSNDLRSEVQGICETTGTGKRCTKDRATGGAELGKEVGEMSRNVDSDGRERDTTCNAGILREG